MFSYRIQMHVYDAHGSLIGLWIYKCERMSVTVNKVDLLDASGSSITLNDLNALDTLWQEFGNQVVRVKDGSLEDP